MFGRNCQTLFSAFPFVSDVFVLTCPSKKVRRHSKIYRGRTPMADPEYKCSTATGYRESRVKDRKIELKDTTKLKNNVKSVCNRVQMKKNPFGRRKVGSAECELSVDHITITLAILSVETSGSGHARFGFRRAPATA